MASELYPKKVKLLPMNDQVRELQTIIRDSTTTPSDFVFYADRLVSGSMNFSCCNLPFHVPLIRLVVEEGLNELPNYPVSITTPTGDEWEGLKFSKGNCGVSISRSGESMEKALRECCRSIRIGKILIDTEPCSAKARLLYTRLWPDIAKRRVLLLYPIMKSGNTILQAMHALESAGVREDRVLLLTLFATPNAVQKVSIKHPEMTILSSDIHANVPSHFGMKYFGTD